MNSTPVGNAAIESTKGTIYQLYIAVLKCFEMLASQRVFIERFGDITVSNEQQIEVKCYADNLTDNHLNFWKTLKNWLRPEFDEKIYSGLILCTTQSIGPNSKLGDWNQSNLAQRLAIIEAIINEAEVRYADRVNSTLAGEKAPPIPESLQYQRHVLHSDKLNEVVKRVVIASGSPDMTDLHARIKEEYFKGLLVGKQDDACAALLGYIVSPPVIDQQGWAISYEAFTAKVADLHSQYCKETKRFPTKYRRSYDSPPPAAPSQRFVQKIHDINYGEMVPKAVKDYFYASDTVAKDFAAYERPPESYQIFSDAVLDQFGPMKSLAKRNLATQPEGEKTFYDQMMLHPVPQFPGFEPPDASFRNGVIHMHQDDEARNLSWKLT